MPLAGVRWRSTAAVLMVAFVAAGAPVGAITAGSLSLPSQPGGIGDVNPGGGGFAAGDPGDWFAWTQGAPVDELAQAARSHAPVAGAALLPLPDSFAAYEAADESDRREAWRAWWIAAGVAAARLPAAGGPAPASSAMQGQGENGEGAPGGGDLGNPRGLDTLWRLEAHGAPHAMLPADGEGAMFLLTDLGVVHVPGPGSKPDWILRLDAVPVRGEVAEAGNMLVVGTPAVFADEDAPTIHVVDVAGERLVHQGQSGDEALLYWRLTDVDGDGEEDILGVDVSHNVTAMKLDGTRIYREPVPEPLLPTLDGVPEEPDPIMPGYLALALERTGAPVFGDATGDGTLDLYALYEYWLDTDGLMGASSVVVSVVSGVDAALVWSQVVDVDLNPLSFLLPAAAGDLTGDGYEDLVLSERRMAGMGAIQGGLVNLVVSGLTGLVMARDDARGTCSVECIPLADAYEPLAVIDRTGDSDHVIVGLKRDSGSVWPPPDAVVVRALQDVPVPGLPTQVLAEHQIDSGVFGYPHPGRLVVRELEGSGVGVVVLFQSMVHAGSMEAGAVYRLTGDEFKALEPGRPVGHYDVNGATGQAFAWILEDDSWVAVSDDGVAPDGDATHLVRSVEPLLVADRDGGGTDLLLPRSLGYHWVSGRTGSSVEHVDRPQDKRPLQAVSVQGRHFVLEAEDDDLVLFDVDARAETWRAGGVLEASAVRGLGDFTGDGEVEVLLRAFPGFGGGGIGGGRDGGLPQIEPGSWSVYSGADDETLWEIEGDDFEVVAMDALERSPGLELMVVDESGGGSKLGLYRVDEDGPRWEADYADVDVANAADGRLLVQGSDGSGTFFDVLDPASGQSLHGAALEAGEEALWGELMELDSRGAYLVYSYGKEHPRLPGAMQQFVVVVDPLGEALAELELSGPEVRSHQFGDITRTFVRWARPGPLVGDWDGGGWQDLALQEGGLGVVRSLRDAQVLAVSPRSGSFVEASDVTGDGRKEVALLSQDGGAMRLYAFDPSQVDLQREDPLSRLDGNQTDNATHGEDLDSRGSPGPAAVVFVGFSALMAGAIRHSRWGRRCRGPDA